MIQGFKSVVLIGWRRDIFPVELECLVDMLSTILDVNNVAKEKCSQDLNDAASPSSVANVDTIQRLGNAATVEFFPGSGGVLSQLHTINFVGAITSIPLFSDVAMDTPWLPQDQNVKGVVLHCSSHTAIAVAMEPELFLRFLGVQLLGKEV